MIYFMYWGIKIFFTTSNSLKLIWNLSVAPSASAKKNFSKSKKKKTNTTKKIFIRVYKKKQNFEKSIKHSWGGR